MNVQMLMIGALAMATLSGCKATQGLNNVGTAASQSANTQAAAQASARCPYALTAQCSGPMVQFSIQNLGQSDLQVENRDFALVVPGEKRKVVPYNKESVTVDLPANVVRPNEKLAGRVVFSDNPMPVGCRLVFKPYGRPDDPGTYADIGGPSQTL
jgi:hypothetical protein